MQFYSFGFNIRNPYRSIAFSSLLFLVYFHNKYIYVEQLHFIIGHRWQRHRQKFMNQCQKSINSIKLWEILMLTSIEGSFQSVFESLKFNFDTFHVHDLLGEC